MTCSWISGRTRNYKSKSFSLNCICIIASALQFKYLLSILFMRETVEQGVSDFSPFCVSKSSWERDPWQISYKIGQSVSFFKIG